MIKIIIFFAIIIILLSALPATILIMARGKKGKEKKEETVFDKVIKSITFIIPMTAVYVAYYNLGPAVALYRFPQMSPPVAGLFAAMLFMPFVGLFWHLVSHLWPVHNIQKSMWTFVFILVVFFGTDYYFYRQAHPELYASDAGSAEQKLVLVPVFEKKYTCANAYNQKTCQIYTFRFGYDDVQKNDEVEVIARPIDGSPYSGNEIGIARCKDCKEQWFLTNKGRFSQTIDYYEKGKYYEIGTGGRRDLEITVRAKRYKKIKEA